jgi:glycerol-3-phosphate dehydrogenase
MPAPIQREFVEKAREGFQRPGLWVLGYGHPSDITIESFGPGRSRFEAGEVAALRAAFGGKAKAPVSAAVGGDGDMAKLKVPMEEVIDILVVVPRYPEISKKELDYIVAEAGQREVGLDEFMEVCFSFFVIGCHELVLIVYKMSGSLKKVFFTPVIEKRKAQRKISVEKSGGSV